MGKAPKKIAARGVKSLLVLLDQINKLAPKRSKSSDGWIGDTKHAARHSDHNAEPDGTVDARDFTNDPNGGMDSQKLCDALVASKDPRISYIICNGKIISGNKGPSPWKARAYKGANGHYHHIHVSVLDENQDDETPWKIESAFKKTGNVPSLTTKQVSSVMKLKSKGEYVEKLQRDLATLGYSITVDSYFGEETELAVKTFQNEHKIKVDGWAGPTTLAAIAKELEKKKTAPKLAAAEKVVDDAAANGKKVSTTEWLTGIVGAGGTVSVVKDVVNTTTETSKSIGELVLTVGPWVLLGLVIAGGAVYIIRDRRNKRLEASALQKVM